MREVKEGNERESDWVGVVFMRVLRDALSKKVTFEQRPEHSRQREQEMLGS